jgi:SLT domain-containing protein
MVMALQAMGNWIKGAAIWTATMIWNGVKVAASWVVSAAVAAAAWVAANATMILVSGGIILLIGAIVFAIYELVKHWKTVWGDIKKWAEDAWKFIYDGWGKFLLPFLGPVGIIALAVIELYKNWKAIWGNIQKVASDFWNWIHGVFGTDLVNFFTKTIPGWWGNMWSSMKNAYNQALSWIKGIPNGIKAVLGNLLQLLVQDGKDVIQGFWNGLTAIWKDVTGWISGIANWIKSHKGPINLDQQLLYPAGHALMSGFFSGLKSGFGPVGSFVGGLAGWIAGQISAAGGKLVGGAVNLAKSAFTAISGAINVGGVQQWIPTILQALAMEHLPSSLLGDVLIQMQSESGGNPNAINLTDINAQLGDPSRGLMQVIGATFRYWHWPGTSWNIYDPLANIAAALNYGAHGKGFGPGMGQIGSGHGYAAGTGSALAGWALVGETGPEAVHFQGGEQVVPMGSGRRGSAAAGASDRRVMITINTNEINPTYHAAQLGWELARRSGV